MTMKLTTIISTFFAACMIAVVVSAGAGSSQMIDDHRDDNGGQTTDYKFCNSVIRERTPAAENNDGRQQHKCTSRSSCLKRAPRQDDLGPFWANRGKKAPSPTYKQDKLLYAEEPRWVLMRRHDGAYDNIKVIHEESSSSMMDAPFFVTRGKKHADPNRNGILRTASDTNALLSAALSGAATTWDKREADDMEFFAARGKKTG